MDEEKIYFWLRLKKDFFKRHDIQIIESMKNGKEYILFYLKLMCESVDHEGHLKFSDTIPYTVEMLSTITKTNIKIVKEAISVFTQFGLMNVLEDGTYFIKEAEKNIGHETDWAKKKREYRERQKEDNVLKSNGQKKDEIRQEIEIEKEIEKEKELEIEIEKDKNIICYQKIADMYNDTCVSFPKVTSLSDARKKAIKARLNKYSEADFLTMFQKAEESAFLKGGNDRNWIANFDWMLKDSNMAKILDGNYDEREKKDKLHKSFDAIDGWLERRQAK